MPLVDAIPGYSCFSSKSRFDEYQLARVEVYTSVSWLDHAVKAPVWGATESGKQCLLLTPTFITGFYFRVEAMSFKSHSLHWFFSLQPLVLLCWNKQRNSIKVYVLYIGQCSYGSRTLSYWKTDKPPVEHSESSAGGTVGQLNTARAAAEPRPSGKWGDSEIAL